LYVAVEPLKNPDPLIVSVSDCEPAACWVGDIDVIEGRGLLGGGVVPPPPPPQLGSSMIVRIISAAIVARGHRRRGMPIRHKPIRGSTTVAIHLMLGVSFAARRSCPSGVVVMVSVVEPDPPVTVVELKLQLVSAGRPEQLKLLTAPLNPFCGDTLMATVCEFPCVTVTCGGAGLSEKSVT
jgi:hypothetical protein